MSQPTEVYLDSLVLSENADGASSVVVVCEHASHYIPAPFDNLGLAQEELKSHAAWDPGALAVASRLAKKLDAPLIASGVSRLVYDCNRPPTAQDAMPTRSEVIDVPGNRDLSQADRDARTKAYYRPFQTALKQAVKAVADPVIVTVHSFTPIYHGVARAVEIGILHDSDARLADAMLEIAQAHTDANVQRNAPYGPDHGVTHTLKEHAIKGGHLNVMLEVRNDLIVTSDEQAAMADMLAGWVADACTRVQAKGVVEC